MTTPERPPLLTRVVVVDFDMPFGQLVVFLIKLALAAIPAGIILGIIYALVVVVLVLLSHSVRGF